MRKFILSFAYLLLAVSVYGQNGAQFAAKVAGPTSLTNTNSQGLEACANTLLSLPNPWSGNAALYGYAFDIVATNSIVVKDLSINPYTYGIPGNTETLWIYTRSGTYVGNISSNLAGWTYQGAVTITGVNTNAIVALNANLNIPVSAGSTLGVCLVLPNANDNARVANSNNGTGTAASNADLEISTGAYLTAQWPNLAAANQVWNILGEVCYDVNSCAASATFKLFGLKSLWKNAGASDPDVFYQGITQWKKISANVTGGIGPYTYSWSNNMGYTLKNQSGNKIFLFEPQGPSWVICEITDQGAGCTFKDSVFVGFSTEYYCGTATDPWKLKMCVGGVNTCMSWAAAKAALLANTATLGDCPPPKTTLANGTSFSVYPNPTQDNLVLNFETKESTNGELMVMDMNGRMLQSQSMQLSSGVTTNTVDLGSLPNGLYIVRLATKTNVFTERVQVLK